MPDPRNPFLKRTSEQIESDSTFLRLFSPAVLELLPGDYLWDRLQVFQSAPGGGKTSLFRLFTPSALLSLHDARANELYQELFRRIKALEAVSDAGPNLLGVYLPCGRTFAMLDDLNLEANQKDRLLYSLLNVRLVLAALRGALQLHRLKYPNDLACLGFIAPPNSYVPSWMPVPGSGRDLFEWARSLERKICETIDSFAPTPRDGLEGYDTAFALSLISPNCFLFENGPVAASETYDRVARAETIRGRVDRGAA
jgi:hypothetical protein